MVDYRSLKKSAIHIQVRPHNFSLSPMSSASTNQEIANKNQEQSSSNEVLVKVSGVSKKFCRDLKKSLWYGVKDVASELLPFGRQKSGTRDQRSANSSSSLTSDLRPPTSDPGLRPGEFWANKDISFELRRGECIGLIGRNGAGKTTLLKMLNGLIKPDSGTIEMRGRVGALIALGAGFNPILTGRENIYVNGSILGLSKEEIDEKIDDIIDFAEIPDFIDSPVQSYSSGMQVRLGFAVATALNPDVLILDEVLAVGDASFRSKCYNRIGSLQKNAAVIFVSHSMQQVSQVCSSILMLKQGQVKWLGNVAGGVEEYNKDNASGSTECERALVIEAPVMDAKLTFFPDEMDYGEILTAKLDLELSEAMANCSVRIPLYNLQGNVVAEWNSKRAKLLINLPSGKSQLEFQIGPLHLGPGTYKLAFVLNDSTGIFLPYWSLKNHSLVALGNSVGSSEYQIPHHTFELFSTV